MRASNVPIGVRAPLSPLSSPQTQVGKQMQTDGALPVDEWMDGCVCHFAWPLGHQALSSSCIRIRRYSPGLVLDFVCVGFFWRPD